jgi:hypothetical protein
VARDGGLGRTLADHVGRARAGRPPLWAGPKKLPLAGQRVGWLST